MALTEQYLEEEIHPIDIVENLAAYHEWDFDRISDEQIAMSVEGQWRTYAITLAWSAFDETLRLICTFEMDPPDDKLGGLFELLNHVNDQCWAGAFTYWAEQKLMVYRYGLVCAGGVDANAEQIDTMIGAAVMSAERYYPALQLQVWGDTSPKEALQVAIAEAYGRA
ncbi:diacylglyceryl transferase [Sulfitobacter sp. M57]|uniref:YbjN domain-containing protein n=1 Tax=unclassified Sulfitobacter TaxID=196795 RepID=UPI0023E3484D|nr:MULTISPECIES: YbjN domain-containing protein [unclassified Sulfitobacter]MDF3415638.1 diacylglyceryl transferase [Sulfitobacter sp. KE5]MDF3423118.1 diacylglyceryl transferase [Sulfitobacter sp. KE43]MDF3434184.1 diacylglyceryl transferase [Sulfitobacter sp. KE42]MDF3459783.1 diacylglyceryl transferase [Sulfitobacter sp. S74]MDF3463722.1 diacylglyceryl transferase [Sulfitobacter sp. Ks18]